MLDLRWFVVIYCDLRFSGRPDTVEVRVMTEVEQRHLSVSWHQKSMMEKCVNQNRHGLINRHLSRGPRCRGASGLNGSMYEKYIHHPATPSSNQQLFLSIVQVAYSSFCDLYSNLFNHVCSHVHVTKSFKLIC